MKELSIDLGQLEMAFEDASWESSYYLDLETGQVIWISQETRGRVACAASAARHPSWC
jgi:hypothetical protein